jgi:hypothetical protein
VFCGRVIFLGILTHRKKRGFALVNFCGSNTFSHASN